MAASRFGGSETTQRNGTSLVVESTTRRGKLPCPETTRLALAAPKVSGPARAGASRAAATSTAARSRAIAVLAAVKEHRLLLGERRHTVLEVFRVAAGRDGLRLELHLRLKAFVRRLVEEELGLAEGECRPLGELPGQGGHRPRELRVGMDPVHQPPLHCLAGGKHAVRVVQLQRAAES